MSRHSTLTDPAIHEPKGISTATNGQVYAANGAGTGAWSAQATIPSGAVIQTIKSIVQSTSTGTALIPYDNTIPQNTEGTQFFAITITPGTIGNRIRILCLAYGAYSVASPLTMALFQDATASALAAVGEQTTVVNQAKELTLIYEYTIASTLATTFYIRIGGSNAGTYTLNGNAGLATYGGTATSILSVQEIKA